MMPEGRPDHSLPPQTLRGRHREGNRGKDCGREQREDTLIRRRRRETRKQRLINDRKRKKEKKTDRMRCQRRKNIWEKGKKMAANKWKERKRDDWLVLGRCVVV